VPFSLRSIPVVRTLLGATLATFLLYFFTYNSGAGWSAFVRFATDGAQWLVQPWTWFTYPFLVTSPLALLLQGYWLYVVGGTLERSWGSRNFGVLFFAFCAIGALGLVPAHYLTPYILGTARPLMLAGLMLPNTALTVAWAALDPELELSFWGIIPVRLKWLALASVLILYFSMGFAITPIPALFSLVSPAAAWYYVRKMPRLNIGFRAARPQQRPAPRRQAPRESVSGFDPLRRRREQAEIERLKRLLGEDDDDRPTRRR